MFASFVAPYKRDGLDSWVITDSINCRDCPMDTWNRQRRGTLDKRKNALHIDYSRRNTRPLTQLRNDHGSPRVSLGRLYNKGVPWDVR